MQHIVINRLNFIIDKQGVIVLEEYESVIA